MSIFLEIEATTPVAVHGYLAIDSLVDGEAHGGLRLSDDVSPDLLRAAATVVFAIAANKVDREASRVVAQIDGMA